MTTSKPCRSSCSRPRSTTAAYEAVAPPHNWSDWYAAYMDARQKGDTPDEASAAAGRYMAEVKHIVIPA